MILCEKVRYVDGKKIYHISTRVMGSERVLLDARGLGVMVQGSNFGLDHDILGWASSFGGGRMVGQARGTQYQDCIRNYCAARSGDPHMRVAAGPPCLHRARGQSSDHRNPCCPINSAVLSSCVSWEVCIFGNAIVRTGAYADRGSSLSISTAAVLPKRGITYCSGWPSIC